MNSLKLSHRLAAGFAVCVLVMVVAGALAVSWLRELSQMQSTMYEKEVVPLRLAGTASWQAATHFRRMYPYILKPDAKSRAETLSLNEASGAEILKAVAFERSNATSDEQKQLIADFDTLWPAYIASTHKVEAAADAGDTQAAMDELNANTDPLHVKLRKLFIRFAELCEKSAHAQTDNGVALVDGAAWRMLALIILGVVVTSLAGWRVVVSVGRQIGGEPAQAAELARHVADGDLTARVALRRGDHASIMAHLAAMQVSLARVVANVRKGSEGLAIAAREISDGNNDLSSRTEQQASALEETAASMEQLSATVRHNADNAAEASRLALVASDLAGSGGEVMNEVVDTMRGISESSKRIADIIGVIDGIAFQTNILALNAAVEAARAGEQGRGFAVVATEVRGLAGRSADAAREIKSLIVTSAERVEQGTLLVDKAGATMTDVVASIKRVAGIVAEISAASSEQSAGVSQIGEAVTQMDQMTQHNAALVEESAAAAESLKAQAQELVEAVGVFKLNPEAT